MLSCCQDLKLGSGYYADGRISWHKIGVFLPTFGMDGVLSAITHKGSDTGGTIPPHVNVTKQYSLLYNHNEHKAVFELKPNKVDVSDFFTKGALRAFKKGGSTKQFKDIVTTQKAILVAKEESKVASSGSQASTWMQVGGMCLVLSALVLHYALCVCGACCLMCGCICWCSF